jgi:hypothetical protein
MQAKGNDANVTFHSRHTRLFGGVNQVRRVLTGKKTALQALRKVL